MITNASILSVKNPLTEVLYTAAVVYMMLLMRSEELRVRWSL